MLITILNKTLINSPVRNCTSLYSTGNKPFSIGANLECEMKTCGIYKITSPSKKIYIGQSVNIKKRFGQYKKMYNSVKQKRLYNSFNKYGADKHKFELIHECSISELNDLEVYYMDLFQSLSTKNGLNTLKGGNQNNYGLKRSQSIVDSFKKRGMPKNALPASNKVTSIPVKQLSLDGQLIKIWPSIKSAASNFDKVQTSIRLCLIGKNKTCAGYKWEYVNKPKPKKITEQQKNCNLWKKRCKKITQLDKNSIKVKDWRSISEAARELKIRRRNITEALMGISNRTGFNWKEN